MAEPDHPSMAETHRKVAEIHDFVRGQSMSDHDLLIRLNTLSEGISSDLSDLKSGFIAQISQLETRVRSLERQQWMERGIAAIIGAIASLAVEFFKR